MLSRNLFELAGFLLGLLFGSFLNVCISRLPEHRSIVTPRSQCPACQHTIRPWDNIPLLSWILLRGRCRDCGQPVSWRYPAVELATALWFATAAHFIFYLHQNDSTGLGSADWINDYLGVALFAILGFLLLGLTVMDWQTHRLPDAFTLTGIATAFFLICTQAIFLGPTEAQINLTAHHIRMSSPGSFVERGNVFLTGPEHLIFGRLLAVSAVTILLLLIRVLYAKLRHREGLGLGDVKMLAMIAAFLGFAPALLTLFLATLLATLYALPKLLTRRATPLTRIPLGTFLGLAGLFSALYADPILTWYSSLFG